MGITTKSFILLQIAKHIKFIIHHLKLPKSILLRFSRHISWKLDGANLIVIVVTFVKINLIIRSLFAFENFKEEFKAPVALGSTKF